MAISAQTFKNLGKSVAYSSLDVLSKLTPNTTELVRGARGGADSVREFVRTQQAKINTMTSQVDRTSVSRKVKAIMEDAWSDIKKGNLALGDLSDESFDDWEKYMSNFDTGSDITSFSNQRMEEVEDSGVSNQGKGFSGQKIPISTDYRTLAGLQNLGDTLGNTTIKSAQYQTGMITNAIFTQMALQDQHFHTMEKQLDSINKNLVELVKFQSESQSKTNAAHLAFYDQMTRYLKKQESRAAERASRIPKRRGGKIAQFLGDDFFDMSAYKELVKNNFESSQFGMLASMLGMMDPTMIQFMLGGGAGGKFQPQKYLLKGALGALIPRRARRALSRGDSQINTMVKTALTRLGNMQYQMDQNPILGLIGSLFGIDSRANRTLRMGNYKRGEMSWNGEAQKALVQVIPKELAEIKAALLKQDARYFDASTGTYMSRKDIRRRTQLRMQDATEMPFANIFNQFSMDPDDVRNKKLWQGMSDKMQEEVSKIVNEAVMGDGGLTDQLSNALDEAILRGISGQGGTKTDTRRMASELSSAVLKARANIESVIRDLQEQNSAFAQIASDMADQYGKIGFNTLQDFIGGASVDLIQANGGRYTYTGRRKESMSEEEARRYEANLGATQKFRDRIRNLSKSKNKVASTLGKIINSGIDYYTGNTDGGRYTQTVTGAADNFFNALYDVFQLGKNPLSNRGGNAQAQRATTSRSEVDNNQRREAAAPTEESGGFTSTPKTEVKSNGGIVNAANRENSNDAKSDPVQQIEKHTRETAETNEKAFGKEGFMTRFFDSPAMKKLMDWMKKSKLGQAAGRKARSAAQYIGNLFTQDYVDEETGETTDSVKTRAKKSFNTAKNAILGKLGVDINGNVNTQDPTTVTGAVQQAAESITDAADVISGEDSSKGGNAGNKQSAAKKKAKTITDQLNKVIRKKAPKHLFAGLLGGAAGLAMGGSTGLLGGLFLPGGPIGGAILGMGLSIMSETDTFKDVIFGKQDKEGNRTGGIINEKMRAGFKRLLPTLGVGALTGVAAKLLTSGMGGPAGAAANAMGFFPSIFLPGGVMGAAILGAAGAYAMKNEKVQDIIFGQKDQDGKRTGTLLSNLYNKFTGKLKSETNGKKKRSIPQKIWSGLKGAAGGLLTAGTIGQMGLLGGALTFGGPIGAAIAGAAVGIASTSDQFQDYLFGEEGKDGKRKKTGLFSRIGKMIEMHLLEPASNYITSTAQQFAWYAREKLEVPFRMIVGPIASSFKDLRDVMADGAKESIKKGGEFLHKKIDNILSPIGNFFLKHILGPMGGLAGKLIKTGLFTGASILGAPLSALSLLLSPTRRKGNAQFGEFLRGNKEQNLQNWWDSQEAETGKKVSGFSKMADRFKYGLASSKRFGAFFRSDEMFADMAQAFGETEEGQGKNVLNYLGAYADRSRYKSNRKAIEKDAKQERRLLKMRQKWAIKDKHAEDRELDPDEVKRRIRQAKKMGINLKDADDLREFTYNYKDWKKTPEEKARDAQANARVVKLDQTAQENLQKSNETAEETKGFVKSIKDMMEKALMKLGIIADNAQAQTDIAGGETVDTEDIDTGDVAKEVDDDVVDKIQKEQAQENAAAIGNVFDQMAKDKAKNENDQRVRGNDSGDAGVTGNTLVNDKDSKDSAQAAENADDKESGGIISSILSKITGGGGNGILDMLGGLFKSKGLMLGMLGSALAMVLSNPDMRQALASLLSDAGKWLLDKGKDVLGNLGNNIKDLLGWGDSGGINNQRLDVDEEGNPVTINNKGLEQAGANLVAKDASKIAKTLSKGKDIFDALGSTSTAKFLSHIPGAKLAGKVVSTVGRTAGKIGSKVVGAAKSIGGKVGSLLKKGGDALSKSSVGQKVAQSADDLVKSAFKLIKEALENVGKTKLGSAFSKVISTVTKFLDDLIKKISKTKLGSKIIQKLTAAMAQTGAKLGSYVVPGLNIVSAVISAGSTLSAALSPETIFKINKDDVDFKMNIIAGIIEGIGSFTGLGAVLSVLNEIVTEVTGNDFIQGLAVTIYSAWAGEEKGIELETAISNMKKEVENYNKANGTNLSYDAYNDKKNKGFFGGIWNGIQGLWGGGDKTDYSQYEVKEGNGPGLNSTSKTQVNKQNPVGYGFGRQDDPRWANMPIGRYSNGRISTMATGGCGPTALSNAANALGMGYDPATMADMATRSGFITDGGANSKLFEDGANGIGMKSTKVKGVTDLMNSLRKGQPVIMSGKSNGYGGDPYTRAGHIVTATGIDKNGNVVVQDPMRGQSRYRAKDLTDKMTHGWAYQRKKSKPVGFGLIDSLFGGAVNAIATGGSATLLSKLTGMDYNQAKEQVAAGATDANDGTLGTTGDVASTNSAGLDLTGNTQAERNWNYLRSQGYTKEATAGIMGCWQAESSNRTDRVEGDYLKSFPGFQQALASNQSLNAWTQKLFNAYANSNPPVKINKDGYKGTDGNYYPGIGLAQWTGPRGYKLFKFAKDNNIDWRDPGAQLMYFDKEIAERGIKDTLNGATSASDGARLALDHYEMYPGYAAKAPSALSKRQGYANDIYNQYKSLPDQTYTGAGFTGTAESRGGGFSDTKKGTRRGGGFSKNVGNGRGPIGFGVLDGLLGNAFNGIISNVANQLGINYTADNNTTNADGTSIDTTGGFGGTGTGKIYPATGNAAEDQQRLVKQMASLIDPSTGEGTIDYSLKGGEQDPDKGKASCASTVAWAYNKVLGFKPGGGSYASSTAQAKDDKFTTIYTNNGNNPVNLNALMPGDIVYQNWDRTSNNGKMQHTEMYAGGGKDLSHGGNPRFGPAYKDMNDYRKKHTMMVRRWNGFIKGKENEGYGVGPDLSVNTVGQYQHRDDIPMGYGPGTTSTVMTPSNKGVESRLDTIISILRSFADSSKPKAGPVGRGPDITINNTKKESPVVVVNQNSKKNIGEADAAHEYLRIQHRKIAAVEHA